MLALMYAQSGCKGTTFLSNYKIISRLFLETYVIICLVVLDLYEFYFIDVLFFLTIVAGEDTV